MVRIVVEITEKLYIRLLYIYVLEIEKQVKYWNVELFRSDEDPIAYLHQLKTELRDLPEIPNHYMTERKHNLLEKVQNLIDKS